MKKRFSILEKPNCVFLDILDCDTEESFKLLRAKLEKELDCSFGEVAAAIYLIWVPFYFENQKYDLIYDESDGSFIRAEPNNRRGLEVLKEKLEFILP